MRKNAKQFVTLTCGNCGCTFQKERKTYNQSNKRNAHNFYCTQECVTLYSPFRYVLNGARKRATQKRKDFDLDAHYLKQLWEAQKGICPYMNIPMTFPIPTHHRPKGSTGGREEYCSPTTLSLDCINATKGYVRGNVEFVCLSINYAKNGFTREQLVEFLNQRKMVAGDASNVGPVYSGMSSN